MLDVSVDAGGFMGIEVKPWLEECPTMDHRVERCREKLLSTPELEDVTLDPDRGDQAEYYEDCMLMKLDLTAREAMVWCEHKGSLARKMALCYEYLLRLNAPHISDRLVVKVIDDFQICLEKGEGPVAPLPHSDENDDRYSSDEREYGPDDDDFNSRIYYPRREQGLANESATVSPAVQRPSPQPTNIGPGSTKSSR
ncbi:hypothetical protein MTO96_019086 [Rhipicephalus appendiculatus]